LEKSAASSKPIKPLPYQNAALRMADEAAMCILEAGQKLDQKLGLMHLSRMWKIETWIVQTLCVIALLFLGLGHQPPLVEHDDALALDFAGYVLPDGTLPTLCITSMVADNKGPSGHKSDARGCEACRISAAVVLPGPTDRIGLSAAFVPSCDLPLPIETVRRQIYPSNSGPRAPPIHPVSA
jgi:hypothetical protein